MINETQVKAVLSKYIDPYLKTDDVESNLVKTIKFDNNNVIVDIVLGYPAQSLKQEIEYLAIETQIS